MWFRVLGFSVRGSTGPTFLDVAIIPEAQSIIRSLTWSTGLLSGLCGGFPHLFWGSPIKRVLVFWGFILGSPIFRETTMLRSARPCTLVSCNAKAAKPYNTLMNALPIVRRATFSEKLKVGLHFFGFKCSG